MPLLLPWTKLVRAGLKENSLSDRQCDHLRQAVCKELSRWKRLAGRFPYLRRTSQSAAKRNAAESSSLRALGSGAATGGAGVPVVAPGCVVPGGRIGGKPT